MTEPIILNTPLTDSGVEKLKIGDRVLLNGGIFTARDAAHKRLAELLNAGRELPIDIRDQIIYYVAPAPARPGKPIGPAGPTTSCRMDPYTPLLLEHGLKGMIGKGNRGKAVIEAIKKHKAVYFAAVGGAAALIARSIKRADIAAYEDLGAEAIYRLEAEDFPVIVAIDSSGNDLYEAGRRAYSRE